MIRLIVLFFLSFPLLTNASTIVDGVLENHEVCQAYISKNKKTNPDHQVTAVGDAYRLVEINRQISPTWLLIELPGVTPVKRWVMASCGSFTYNKIDKQSCQLTPGLADAHVLALSWQPGFCQTYGYEAGKPECLALTPASFAATHLVLHGLWPNQNSCGQNYGFCGVSARTNHCDYAPVVMNETVSKALRQMMPSYAAGSCLERHEWNKHGSCQALSTDDYFGMAVHLGKAVNDSDFGLFLAAQVGQFVSLQALRDKLDESFGVEASHKISLSCKGNVLVDIYLQLPSVLDEGASLTSLLMEAPTAAHSDGCPARIKISDFSANHAYQSVF